LEHLNPEKLTVEYTKGVTATEPIIGRKYTLTHSDITAELFLTIGLEYAYEKVTNMRDEVLAEWRTQDENPFLFVYVSVDGEYGMGMTTIRNRIFRRELPLALEAIRYGDNPFFEEHTELNYAQVWIYFDSVIPYYNSFENWGILKNYE
jgi:hypothetical protein